MKRRVLPLISAISLATTAGAQQALPVVVLRHANVADGARGAIATNAAVVIRDGRIAQIESEPFNPPAGATVIDVGGRYVVPGLIDAHTHISTLANARRALESGVTTVRSASTNNYQDVALRDLVKQGAIDGPDVLAAGVFVTPDLGETMLADARLGALKDGVTSEAALREVVRINLDHKVDVIKTRGTERAGLPNTDPRKQTYTEQQLAWIVDEATKGGVPVMAHAHGDEGAYAAVKAGVRSIEHGTYLADSTLTLMRQRGKGQRRSAPHPLVRRRGPRARRGAGKRRVRRRERAPVAASAGSSRGRSRLRCARASRNPRAPAPRAP